MAQPTAHNPWIQRSLFLIVAASLLSSTYLDVMLRNSFGLLRLMDIYASSEADLVRAADGQNAAINFEDFQIEQGGFATTFYFLGNYALWPKRLFPSTAPVVIDTGFDLLAQGFQPDDDWLRAHDCAGVMTYLVIRGGNDFSFHAKFRPVGDKFWIPIH